MKAWHALLFLICIIIVFVSFIYYYDIPVDNFTQASKIINYEKHILVEKIKPSTFVDHRSLYELHHSGIPDIYDNEGNKIKGVEPDPIKVIYHLENLISSDKCSIKDELFEAKLYHQGMHNLEPDLEKAEELYKKLYAKLYNKFDGTGVEPTQDELDVMAECTDEINQLDKMKVYEWLNLGPDGAPRRNIEEDNYYDQPIENTRNVTRNVGIVGDMRNYNFDDNFDIIVNHEAQIVNDPQNVHNSTVLSTIKNSLKKLSVGKNNFRNQHQSVNEIRTIIENLKGSDKKNDAIKSLNTIMMQNTKIHSLDMDELEILDTIWNRIKDEHKENEDVVNTLVCQLADMQEHGNTVCSTGRATRLVDTLNVIDKDVKIMPTYAVNEEMMLTASNIREKMYQEQTSEERKLLENGTSLNQEDFDNKLKIAITSKLKKDYVTTGILSEEKFNTELSKWINEI